MRIGVGLGLLLSNQVPPKAKILGMLASRKIQVAG